MKITKSTEVRTVDVYSFDGVEFLSEAEAVKFMKERLSKPNETLYAVEYAPRFKSKYETKSQVGTVVYTKKIFVSVENRETESDVPLIVALNKISKVHKELLEPKIINKKHSSSQIKEYVAVDGFKIEKIEVADYIEYDEVTKKSYEVNGKSQCVKLYKADKFGNVLNLKNR